MADLLQSSTSAATTTPAFYTNYLSNLASKGTAAGNAASSPSGLSAYDPNALQNQAYSNVVGNVGNYKPGLAAAGQTTANAAGANIRGAVQPYLNTGTTIGGPQAALPYIESGLAQNTGAASANSYLKAGTSMNGVDTANPYLKGGTAVDGLSQANPYLQQGSQGADQLVNNYMNPYTQQVVDRIAAGNLDRNGGLTRCP
jgi:hypothetical protein